MQVTMISFPIVVEIFQTYRQTCELCWLLCKGWTSELTCIQFKLFPIPSFQLNQEGFLLNFTSSDLLSQTELPGFFFSNISRHDDEGG